MRIVAGEARGRRLRSADLAGLRPSLDRVREALFSILGDVSGASVLDLFAGTGALGIEALSRGAGRTVFVEGDPQALELVRANLASSGLAARASVRHATLPRGLESLVRDEQPFDLVLADPPYEGTARDQTLTDPYFDRLLAPQGLLVVEHDAHHPPAERLGALERVDQRRYGSTRLSFYRRPAASGELP